jgi:hypothetical protein
VYDTASASVLIDMEFSIAATAQAHRKQNQTLIPSRSFGEQDT